MKKICVVTTTRAESGLLNNFIQRLCDDDFFDVTLLVSGTHLLKEFGYTISEIKKSNLATHKNRSECIKILKGIFLSQAERSLRKLELIETQILEVEELLDKEIDGDKSIETLITVPGVGKQLASSFVAFLGDGSRYPNVSSIGAATGLVPRLDMSSTSLRLGHITKKGNSNLRSLLILAAWSHVRAKNGGALKEKYLYMTITQSKSKKVAIVAIARKIAELMYSLLKNNTQYEKRAPVSIKKLATEALVVAS